MSPRYCHIVLHVLKKLHMYTTKQLTAQKGKNLTQSEKTKEKSVFIINLSDWSNIQMLREKQS